LTSRRRGISTAAIAGIIVVVVVIAAVGTYFATVTSVAPVTQVRTETQTQVVTQTTETSFKPVKVAALLSSGTITDRGWSQNAYFALTKAKARYGAEIAYSERVSFADITTILSDYAARGFDLVIGHGGEYPGFVADVAKNFPNARFMTTAGPVDAANVRAYDPKYYEPYWVIGVIAAHLSQSGKIGFITGQDFPPIQKMLKAYELGAKSVKPNIEVISTVTGDFLDFSKHKEAGKAQIEAGADFIAIWSTADEGVIEAAKEAGRHIWIAASVSDRAPLAPNLVVTTALFNVDVLIDETVRQLATSSFKSGIFVVGLKEGVNDLTPINEKVPESVRQAFFDAREKIINGTVEFPPEFQR
jgi:basic membrane protein A